MVQRLLARWRGICPAFRFLALPAAASSLESADPNSMRSRIHNVSYKCLRGLWKCKLPCHKPKQVPVLGILLQAYLHLLPWFPLLSTGFSQLVNFIYSTSTASPLPEVQTTYLEHQTAASNALKQWPNDCTTVGPLARDLSCFSLLSFTSSSLVSGKCWPQLYAK